MSNQHVCVRNNKKNELSLLKHTTYDGVNKKGSIIGLKPIYKTILVKSNVIYKIYLKILNLNLHVTKDQNRNTQQIPANETSDSKFLMIRNEKNKTKKGKICYCSRTCK